MQGILHNFCLSLRMVALITWILIKGYFYCLFFAPVVVIREFGPGFPKSWREAHQLIDNDPFEFIYQLFSVLFITGIFWLFLIGVPFVVFGAIRVLWLNHV